MEIQKNKIDVQVNSPESGTVLEHFANEGDTVSVGGNLFKIKLGDAPPEGSTPPPPAPKKEEPQKEEKKAAPPPPPAKAPEQSKPAPTPAAEPKKAAPKPSTVVEEDPTGKVLGSRTETRVSIFINSSHLFRHLKKCDVELIKTPCLSNRSK
jgi:2-oxoglutarate dehydrogenase E2 component (dihydrolipoamide succinyltransferase)